ncbi:MAG: DUF4252 domain-containing protein [Holophagales bacterium]|nr:DUF4252 domain-containing protein [Holophagales bacterium]
MIRGSMSRARRTARAGPACERRPTRAPHPAAAPVGGIAALGALCAILCLALPAVPSGAQEAWKTPAESLPGYFDLDRLELFSRDELQVHISVKGPLLRLVAGATADDEPELAAMLQKLSGVEVRVYSTGERKREKVRGILDRLAGTLSHEGWQTAITVRVERDHGYAFLRYADDGDPQGLPLGLAAMYLTDDNQAVFVNIVGQLDTATISRLARRFELDLLTVEDPSGSEDAEKPSDGGESSGG